jgi:hypothetical protein
LIILTLVKACIAFLKKERDRLNADQHRIPFHLFQIKQGDDAKTCNRLNADQHCVPFYLFHIKQGDDVKTRCWNANMLNMYGLKDWRWNTCVEYACVESLAVK